MMLCCFGVMVLRSVWYWFVYRDGFWEIILEDKVYVISVVVLNVVYLFCVVYEWLV